MGWTESHCRNPPGAGRRQENTDRGRPFRKTTLNRSRFARLLEATELRVARAPPGGIFHPKFYRFHGLEGTVCWVGSPNFTRGGFGGNTELVKEFADTNDERRAWFEALWQGLEEDPRPAIAQYEGHYRPPRPLGVQGRCNGMAGRIPESAGLGDLGGFRRRAARARRLLPPKSV